MDKLICELETILQSLIDQHAQLLEASQQHQQAMRSLDNAALEQAGRKQEQCRSRIAVIEKTRRQLTLQVARLLQMKEEPSIRELAARIPTHREKLTELREKLTEYVVSIRTVSVVSSRIAGALLGHFNTAIRLLAGASGSGGVYTAQGPAMSRRVGGMEAVG